jgi:DNA-binding transcriptional MerR regulator
MPKPKRVLNAFTAQQVQQVAGLSVHMINYLAREGYLVPTYAQGSVRGKIRYYSYRDLVVARIVQRLREVGIELKRLKRGIQMLSSDATWLKAGRVRSIALLGTDGKKLFFPDENGSLVELTRDGQRSFAFVLEPIQEVGIHGQRVDLVNRRSMRRIIARRMKAATVVA